MIGDLRPARFVSGSAVCTGTAAEPHPPVEVVPEPNRPFTCPLCGQRYLLDERARSIDPAAWPRQE